MATITEEIRDTLKANKAEALWGANTTHIIDSSVRKPLLTKEEAKHLDPLDIMLHEPA